MKTLILISFILCSFSVFAQDSIFVPTEQIRKTLKANDKKSLTEIEKSQKERDDLVKTAEKDLIEADNQLKLSEKANSKEKKKAIKKMEKFQNKAIKSYSKAGKLAEKNYQIEYNIYKRELDKLEKEATDDKKESLSVFKSDASGFYRQFLSDLEKAKKAKENNDKIKYYRSSFQQISGALSVQIQAFAENYEWYKKDDIKTTNNDKEFEYEIFKGDSSSKKVEEVVIIEEKKIENKQQNVTFRIQIAASKVPLSLQKLRQIYPKNVQINNEKDGEWYKYTVGEYDSYQAAWDSKVKMNIQGTFVSAYKEGKRVKNIAEVTSANSYNNLQVNSNNSQTNINSDGTEYRIQIAMSRLPADDLQIKKLNPTTETVKTYRSDGFYKYTIGSFNSEQNAVDYKNKNNLTKAIVVKYKNDIQIK